MKSFSTIILLCGGIGAGLLISELGLRIFGPRYYRFNNNSNQYYTNPRNYYIPLKQDDDGRTVFGLNYPSTSEGYRLPFDRGKPADILLVGDSFTFGRGVRPHDLYSAVCERQLHGYGTTMSIRNCGKNGENTDGILITYEQESSKQHYPLVVYGFTLNDFGHGGEKIVGLDLIDINNGGNAFNSLRHASALVNFFFHAVEKRRLHRITIKGYKKAFQDENKWQMLKELNLMVMHNKSRLVILLFPMLYDFENYPFADIHRMMATFCEQENIPLLDLLPAFGRNDAEDLWASPTDHHPNETAHRIAAGELSAFIRKHGIPGKK